MIQKRSLALNQDDFITQRPSLVNANILRAFSDCNSLECRISDRICPAKSLVLCFPYTRASATAASSVCYICGVLVSWRSVRSIRPFRKRYDVVMDGVHLSILVTTKALK